MALRAHSAFGGLVVAVASLVAGCSAVLGMDSPFLDPCVRGCVDGSIATSEAGAGDASAEGSIDTRDAGDAGDAPARPPHVDGVIPCGGGNFPIVDCKAPTPVCCQLEGDAGYACKGVNSPCGGYRVECASPGDCPGDEICCHFENEIKCIAHSGCSNESLVCVPDGDENCPPTWKCEVPFVTAGQTSPYLACTR